MIITIDGPSGAGKSSISTVLSQRLGFEYLDTGAMYRASALHMKQKGISLSDRSSVAEEMNRIEIGFDDGRVFLNGVDVSEEIRTPEMDMAASEISKIPDVRKHMTRMQRKIAQEQTAMNRGLIAEGRDMGTVVFPDAHLKIFLDASPEERAKRRYRQLSEKGLKITFETILQQIKKRDKNDKDRDIAPLKPASDAVIIDSSEMNIEQVTSMIIDLINNTTK